MKGEILHGQWCLKMIGRCSREPFMQTLYPHRSVGCGSSEGGVKQVDLPELMPRARGQASKSGARERLKIIHAEGEYSSAQRLVYEASLLAEQPVSVRLRYLRH